MSANYKLGAEVSDVIPKITSWRPPFHVVNSVARWAPGSREGGGNQISAVVGSAWRRLSVLRRLFPWTVSAAPRSRRLISLISRAQSTVAADCFLDNGDRPSTSLEAEGSTNRLSRTPINIWGSVCARNCEAMTRLTTMTEHF